MAPLVAVLLEKWDAAAATAGVLRSMPTEAQHRVLDGELQLVAQFNPSHAQRKRPVDEQLLRPTAAATPPASSSSGFNFTKIRPNELLCALSFDGSDESDALSQQVVHVHAAETLAELPRHAVLVNVSPLMRGHSLVVLDLPQVKPQKLERQYLRNGLSIVCAAHEPHFALGFNSVGAWSSVNHFHLQGFFMDAVSSNSERRFPILNQPRRKLFECDGAAAFEIPDWPMHCYAIGASEPRGATSNSGSPRDAFSSVVKVAWTLVALLQTRSIPHNVLLANDASSQPLIVVFPRQPQRENGAALLADAGSGSEPAAGALRFAIAELSGLVVCGSASVFQRLSQQMFTRILKTEISLTQEEAESVTTKWQQQLL